MHYQNNQLTCGNLCGKCGGYPAKSLILLAVTVLREVRRLLQQLLDIKGFFVRSLSPYIPYGDIYGSPPAVGAGGFDIQPHPVKTILAAPPTERAEHVVDYGILMAVEDRVAGMLADEAA